MSKGREKITKIWISWEQKGLCRWNEKTFFIVFEGLSFGENKNLIKLEDFLDSSKLYRRLLVTLKTGCSRKLFPPKNDFNKDDLKPKTLSDLLWLNELNKLPKSFWMCHKIKIHQEIGTTGNG